MFRPTSFSALLLLLATTSMTPGCLVLRSQHDELATQVKELETQLAERDQELQTTLTGAQEQSAVLQSQLEKAEKILRANQASVGVRVENLEAETAGFRGMAEDNQNAIAALSSNLEEMRSDSDSRIAKLEQNLQEATNIPDGKQGLYAQAEELLTQRNYKQARRLFRTYLSRYPNDQKSPRVRFKIGLTLFSERDYRSALGEFYWITQNAVSSAVMPDALYYSGLAFARLGQCKDAIVYFDYVTRRDIKAPKQYIDQAKAQVKTLKADKGEICKDAKPGQTGAPGKVTPKAGAKATGNKRIKR